MRNEQWATVPIDELLAEAATPSGRHMEPCQAPEGFFEPIFGVRDHLAFRFKGIIEDAGVSPPTQGISNFTAYLRNQRYPIHGLLAGAVSRKDGGIDVFSYGPSRRAGVEQKRVWVEWANPEVAGSFPKVFLEDLYKGADPDPGKRCVVAMVDPTASSRFFVCNPESLSSTPGDTLRIFGNIALNTRRSDIVKYLKSIGRSRCRKSRS